MLTPEQIEFAKWWFLLNTVWLGLDIIFMVVKHYYCEYRKNS